MPTSRTFYLNLPALNLKDNDLGISFIVTAMRAKLIMDNIDEIREFFAEAVPNIDQERDERQVMKHNRRQELP